MPWPLQVAFHASLGHVAFVRLPAVTLQAGPRQPRLQKQRPVAFAMRALAQNPWPLQVLFHWSLGHRAAELLWGLDTLQATPAQSMWQEHLAAPRHPRMQFPCPLQGRNGVVDGHRVPFPVVLLELPRGIPQAGPNQPLAHVHRCDRVAKLKAQRPWPEQVRLLFDGQVAFVVELLVVTLHARPNQPASQRQRSPRMPLTHAPWPLHASFVADGHAARATPMHTTPNRIKARILLLLESFLAGC